MSESIRCWLRIAFAALLVLLEAIAEAQGAQTFVGRLIALVSAGVIGYNYAILEYLSERHPEAGS